MAFLRKPGLPLDKLLRLFLLSAMVTAALSLLGSDTFPTPVALGYLSLLFGNWFLPRRWDGMVAGKTAGLLFLIALLFFLLDWYLLSQEFMAAVIHFILVVSLLRLYTLRTVRDFYFLLLISLCEIIAACVLSVGLYFLFGLIFYLPSAFAVLILLEIKRNANREEFLAENPAFRTQTNSLRLFPFLAMSFGLLVLVAVFAVPLFFVLPRLQHAFYARQGTGNPLSGFTDRVTLGEFGEIKTNTEVVMRVRLDPRQPTLSGQNPLRWRGLILEKYDGKSWSHVPSSRTRLRAASREGHFTVSEEKPRGPVVKQTYYLQPLSLGVLFTLSRAFVLHMEGDPIRYPVVQDRMGVLSRYTPYFQSRTYSVWSDIYRPTIERLRRAPRVVPVAKANIRAYFDLPELDPRIRRLSETLTGGLENHYDQVMAVERFLKQQYRYSLFTPEQKAGADPLAVFMFESKQGHCEYFASAMAVLLRYAGIPCRLVGGFIAGEYNELGRDWIVRQSHAHVWVEVFFPGESWVEFDPTPSSVDSVAESHMNTFLLKLWDAAELYWEDTVLRYDLSGQVRLFYDLRQSLRGYSQGLVSRIQGYQSDLDSGLKQWLASMHAQGNEDNTPARSMPRFYGWIFLPIGLLLLGVLYWWRRMTAFAGVRYPLAKDGQGARKHYDEMVSFFAGRGKKKTISQTPWEFAKSFPEGDLSSLVCDFTSLYYRIRYRQGVEGKSASDDMRRLLAQIKKKEKAQR